MFIVGFLITALVWINYYFKKNIYQSVLIGSILFFIYLTAIEHITLSVLFFKSNFKIYIILISFYFFLVTLKKINIILKNSIFKKKVSEITNFLVPGIILKIFLLIIFSLLMYNTPIISFLFLFIIGTFLNLSIFNLILSSLLLATTSYFTIFSLEYFETNIIYGILIIIIYFIITIIIYFYEEKNILVRQDKKNIVIEIIMFLLVSELLFLILHNIFDIRVVLIIIFAIIILINKFFFEKYSVLFDNKKKINIKNNELEIIKETNISYSLLGLFLFTYFFLYIILIYYLMIGLILMTVFNLTIIKYNKTKIIDHENVSFTFLYILIAVNYILFNSIEYNNSEIVKIFSYYAETNNTLLAFLTNIQSFIFLPYPNIQNHLTILENNFSDYNIIIYLKFELIIFIQVLFGLVNLYIIKYTFSIKEKDINALVVTFLVISSILQFIVVLL